MCLGCARAAVDQCWLVGWADLEPWDRRARLARVHPQLLEDCLVAAGRSIPELRPEIDAQRSREDRVRVVLRYFGDEQHPNPDPEHPAPHGPGVAHDCPRWVRLPPLEDSEAQAERGGPADATAGRKSRWHRVDLETIFVKRAELSARKLVQSGELVEPVHHQRISELRARGDIHVVGGRVELPPGTTGEGSWVTLPKRA